MKESAESQSTFGMRSERHVVGMVNDENKKIPGRESHRGLLWEVCSVFVWPFGSFGGEEQRAPLNQSHCLESIGCL